MGGSINVKTILTLLSLSCIYINLRYPKKEDRLMAQDSVLKSVFFNARKGDSVNIPFKYGYVNISI